MKRFTALNISCYESGVVNKFAGNNECDLKEAIDW